MDFRPTNDMLLAPIEAQFCAYLFQKTNNPMLMLENIVKVGDITATRADLLCLKPNRPISMLVSSNKQVLILNLFIPQVLNLSSIINFTLLLGSYISSGESPLFTST